MDRFEQAIKDNQVTFEANPTNGTITALFRGSKIATVIPNTKVSTTDITGDVLYDSFLNLVYDVVDLSDIYVGKGVSLDRMMLILLDEAGGHFTSFSSLIDAIGELGWNYSELIE